jgi:hypothetical protein
VNETKTNATEEFSLDNDDWEWQHSVKRYWQNPDSNWIESEYLFDTQKEDRVFYQVIDVFDDYAIGYKDDIFTVIFYKSAFANLIAENYHVKAYEQEDYPILGFDYWDQDGKGDYSLIMLVEYPGSIIVTPVSMVISVSSSNARFAA